MRAVSRGLIEDLNRLFQEGTEGDHSDAVLLARFLTDPTSAAGELAFRALVNRHLSTITSACERVLAEPHDASDAIQATLIVLSQRAHTIRDPSSVGKWLHRVALNTALRVRSEAAQRRARECPDADPGRDVPEREAKGDDGLPCILRDELEQLRPDYREVLVLCCLEGLKHDEAASRLGLKATTVSKRLERARKDLRARLVRRGYDNKRADSLLIIGLFSGAGRAARTPPFVRSTASAAIRLASSERVAQLVSEVLMDMRRARLIRMIAGTLLAIAGAGAIGSSVARMVGDPAPNRIGPAGLARRIGRPRGASEVLSIRATDYSQVKGATTASGPAPVGPLSPWTIAESDLLKFRAPGGHGDSNLAVLRPRGTEAFYEPDFKPVFTTLEIPVSRKPGDRANGAHVEDLTFSPDAKSEGDWARQAGVDWHWAWPRFGLQPDQLAHRMCLPTLNGRLAVVLDDGEIRLYESGSPGLFRVLPERCDGPAHIRLSPDGKFLAVVRFERRKLRVRTSEVRGLGTRADRDNPPTALLDAYGGAELREQGFRLVGEYPYPGFAEWALAVHGRADWMAFSYVRVTCRILDIDRPRRSFRIPPGANISGGPCYPTVQKMPTPTLFDWSPQPVAYEYDRQWGPGHPASSNDGIAFSGDSRFVATAGSDGCVRLYDLRTGNLSRVLDGPGAPVLQVFFNPSGTHLASISVDGQIRIWKI